MQRHAGDGLPVRIEVPPLESLAARAAQRAKRCGFCGGELAPGISAQGVSRCLACGKGTRVVEEPAPRPSLDRVCGKETECGGTCVLAPEHAGGCECAGDEPGRPGTCPA